MQQGKSRSSVHPLDEDLTPCISGHHSAGFAAHESALPPLGLARSLSHSPCVRSCSDDAQEVESPTAVPLLRSSTPFQPSDTEDLCVSVTVLPDAPAGKASIYFAQNISGVKGLNGLFPSEGSIKANYTGSAAKRRSSAANIMRKQLSSVKGRQDNIPDSFLLTPGEVLHSGRERSSADSSHHGGTVAQQTSVFDLLDKKERMQTQWQRTISMLLDSVPYTIASLVITFMVLYSDDFRVAVAPPSADTAFRAFTMFCLVFFCLEIMLSSLSKPRYFLGFYFLIDFVALFSLLFDIPEFMAALTGQSEDGSSSAPSTLSQASNEGQSNLRAARIAQVIRVVRLIRIVKLYKIYAQNKHRLESAPGKELHQLVGEKQSRVGEKLSELTIRKVIIMVLALLFLLPVFESSVGWYGAAPTLDDGGLELLHTMYGVEGNTSAFKAAVQVYLDQAPYKLGTRRTSGVLTLYIHNQTLVASGELDNRRDSEVTSAVVETAGCRAGSFQDCSVSAAFFDTRWFSQVQGLLNMGRTTFIILTLVTAALLFMRDADKLVLQPLERMMKKVKDVSENPLARSTVPSAQVRGDRGQQMETRILENSITKICSLLSVGFGEAGAEVIADNIRSGGDLNPMIPGRKVHAIFGFCDIRQFTDTTEVLQEDVMEFVNSIAKIVHMEVALHGGAANKNIGDAFLLVWKLPPPPKPSKRVSSTPPKMQAVMDEGEGAAAAERHHQEMSFIADAALASFVIIQSAIKRSAKLRQYCTREDLNARMPNFSIKMGFGLHVGWAIEGAIGSEFKIDASYLSPHVNMASRLEAATKQFGASILLSEEFVSLLSPKARPLVRQIDRVTVKGSTQPMGLYTYDTACDATEPEAGDHRGAAGTAATAGCKSAALPPLEATPPEAHQSFSLASYTDEFQEHPDIVTTRVVDHQFLELFHSGLQAYESGEWEEARRVFEECRASRRNRQGEVVGDGPSETLLRFMGDHGFRAPEDWRGFRELTEK